MAIKEFLRLASKKYYEGNPIISDEEFDALTDQYNFTEVGSPTSDKIPHMFRMFSLQKFYPEDEVPFSGFTTIKLDGAAISLLYMEGELYSAISRGDGITGQNILSNIKRMNNIPKTIRNIKPIIQVTGEIVAPASIKNARNYAAGALNLKSGEEFSSRQLYFFAYGINPFIKETYSADLAELRTMGFDTIDRIPLDTDEFPSDGKVVRIDNNKEFNDLGYTSHHPRGAYALKVQKEGVITTLEKVVWNVGRTGVVAPVAVLTPVEIDGARVASATLHNMKYIEALGLEEGCKVSVIRSGGIIPRVVKRIE